MYYYTESIDGFDLYVSNGLEGEQSVVNHLGTLYEEVHAKLFCRMFNEKIQNMYNEIEQKMNLEDSAHE